MNETDRIANDKRCYFQQAAERELPLPVEPLKPAYLVREEERIKAEREHEKRDEYNRKPEKAGRSYSWSSDHEKLLRLTEDGKARNISEIMEENLYISDMSNKHISELLRIIVREGLLEKETINHRVFYNIP